MGPREKILSKALEIFAEKGFEGTSIREICSAVDVNISSIKYYFEDKAGLFREILESFEDTSLRRTVDVLAPVSTVEGLTTRLEVFIEANIQALLENTHLHTLIQKEIENLNPIAIEVFQNTIFQVINELVAFFDQAKVSGVIHPDVDTLVAAYFLIGQINTQIRSIKLSEVILGTSVLDPDYRKKWVQQSIFILSNGITKKPA